MFQILFIMLNSQLKIKSLPC